MASRKSAGMRHGNREARPGGRVWGHRRCRRTGEPGWMEPGEEALHGGSRGFFGLKPAVFSRTHPSMV